MVEKQNILIISDLDGTFLNKRHIISPLVRKRINKLISNSGLSFTFATSRDDLDFNKAVSNISINAPIILCNGSVILDHITGKTIHEVFLHENDVKEIIKMFLEDLTTINIVYIDNGTLKRHRFKEIYDDSEIINYKIVSIAINISEKKLISTYLHKFKALEDSVSINVYQNPYVLNEAILDLTPIDGNKGNAVNKLKSMFSRNLYTIGFGNDYNDISLLQECDCGVSVGRCPAELINISDYQIPYTEGHSVLNFIEKIINKGMNL